MSEVIFSEVSENELLRDENDAADLMHEVADISFEADTLISYSEQATIDYVAGYVARSIQKSLKCNVSCHLFSGEAVQIYFEKGSVSKEKLEAKENVLAVINRGGLPKPRDINI